MKEKNKYLSCVRDPHCYFGSNLKKKIKKVKKKKEKQNKKVKETLLLTLKSAPHSVRFDERHSLKWPDTLWKRKITETLFFYFFN